MGYRRNSHFSDRSLGVLAGAIFCICILIPYAGIAESSMDVLLPSKLPAPPNCTPLPPFNYTPLPSANFTSLPPFFPEITPAQPPQPAWYAEHDKAVNLARHNAYEKSLAELADLHKEHPDDLGITRDYLVVLGWAGHDKEAIGIYKTLPKGPEPDYVLAAVGHAYRDLGQPENALAIYQQGLKQSPKNVAFATGKIRSLTDMGRLDEALQWADMDLHMHGDRLDVLMAAADAAYQDKKTYKALYYNESIVRLDPKNRDALLGLIRINTLIGAPQLALKLADEHPGLISDEEYRHIQGDEAALLVRWGTLEPPSEKERFAATDQAIANLDELIARWSPIAAAHPDVLRERFDRIVALRNRSRMQEAITEYNALLQEGVPVPDYALSSVADAYLYLREPEKARDLYLKVLQTQPNNFAVRRQLFYSYVECNDFDNAYKEIDSLDNQQPVWTYLKGLTDPLPNPARVQADVDAGNARMFAGELEEADGRLTAIANAAPDDAGNHAALGALYEERGLPRQAQAQYEIGTALQDGKDVTNETGIANTELELQHFQAADAKTQDLANRFPENTDVQRAERLEQVHNMAELDVTAGYLTHPSTSVQGGDDLGVETKIYSSPIDYNWRIFADEYFSHENEPGIEGDINLSRTAAGVEYRDGDLTADAAPTDNVYHDHERIGGWAESTVALDDQWSISDRGEIFSRDTPLRAINAGVTADSVNAGVTWRENESRSVSLTGEAMHFSDDNERTSVDGAYTQRIYTQPNFYVEAMLNIGESQNSQNEDRLYYNPSRDVLGLVGGRAVQTLYQNYQTIYEHSLQIMPGAYWEQNYGTSGAVTIRYEQRIRYNDVIDAAIGLNFTRQSYDGAPENDVGITFNLIDRF